MPFYDSLAKINSNRRARPILVITYTSIFSENFCGFLPDTSDLYSLIQEYIDYGVIADANGYYANWCSIGPDKFTYTGLEKGTYRIYGFGIDNSGQVATDLMFSEEFTVGQ